MFIINPFNLVYFGYLVLNILIIIGLSLLLRKKSEKTKYIVLMSICIFNALLWVIYKVVLFIGNKDLASTGFEFNIWKELPFHLCNISIIIVPIGLALRKKWLYAYGFYVAVLGAFMAVTFPCLGFYNTSIFGLHNIGFYGTHGLIIVVGVLLVTLGFLKPSFKDIPILVFVVFALGLFAFILNLFFKYLIHVDTNYFYVMEPEGISILELFWKILPVKFVYLIFGIVILIVYSLIIDTPFMFVEKMKEKNQYE